MYIEISIRLIFLRNKEIVFSILSLFYQLQMCMCMYVSFCWKIFLFYKKFYCVFSRF